MFAIQIGWPIFSAHMLVYIYIQDAQMPNLRFSCADYEDESPLKDSGLKPPMMADLIRTTSLQWSNNGHDSFKSIKKKLQKVTSEIRHTGSLSYS